MARRRRAWRGSHLGAWRDLQADGFIMLSDFGASEKFAERDGRTSGRTGTRSYMPPEALMSGGNYGLEFDWYSFGVTVFEMLAG